MRNKYKSLQNKGPSQNDNSYTNLKKINQLQFNQRTNNINKTSFVSNFDSKEKFDKMINQINDKEKKPFNEIFFAINNDRQNLLERLGNNFAVLNTF